MAALLRSPNGNAVFLTPRSGTHSLSLAVLREFWPQIEVDENVHPASLIPRVDGEPTGIAIVVRNPIERFRSMTAHLGLDVAEHIGRLRCVPLPRRQFDRYFLFETELKECARWLGVTGELPHESPSEGKPDLSEYEVSLLTQIFWDDLKLWESLHA